MKNYIISIRQNWQKALHNKVFRKVLISAILVLIIVSFATHFFFNYNEDRPGGVTMNDWVLNELPAKNVSVLITPFITSVVLLFFIRMATQPTELITALIAYIFLLVFRITTIAITHFQTPPRLVALTDPMSNLVYGARFITKDLFFSGHIATIFLIYLCLSKKTDRSYVLFAAFSMALLLLIQHVHYTIDVISAPFFALGCLWLAKRMVHKISHSRF